MKQPDNLVFTGLKIISWIIFVGLCISAGALLVNFVFAVCNPNAVSSLYQNLDLHEMYVKSKWSFFGIYGFILLISILKAMLFYNVIRLVSKINLFRPFNIFAAKQITCISGYTLQLGVLSYIGRQVAKHLQHGGFNTTMLDKFWDNSEAFILMAAVVYIIAHIFKKGVEMQTENDLTV